MKFYLGGYFLIKQVPLNYGTEKGRLIYSCSDCFNENLVESWAYSWTTDKDLQTEEAKEKLKLTDDKIDLIRPWVDKLHDEHRLGLLNVFIDLESAIAYKETFFAHLDNIKVLALYFDENETRDILSEFKPKSDNFGEIGLRLALLKQQEEQKNELLIGYDLIGIENGGNFHSFHCHDIVPELQERFQLRLNSYGLFDESENWKPVTDFLNDEENGLEPVPWFVAKTKIVMID